MITDFGSGRGFDLSWVDRYVNEEVGWEGFLGFEHGWLRMNEDSLE